MHKKQNKLLIFTKSPIHGEVKTRLQPEFTVEQSLNLHKILVRNTLSSLSNLSAFDVELCCAPNRQHLFFLDCEKSFDIKLSDQFGDDLGERMAFSFSMALQRYEKVIIVGTDCPELNEDYICEALEKLDKYDSVIGPAEDGGYVLLGLKKFAEELFLNHCWGSNTVFQQTQKVFGELSWSHYKLGIMHDIDRPEDLHRYQNLLNEIS